MSRGSYYTRICRSQHPIGWLQVTRSQDDARAPLATLLLQILTAIPLTLAIAAGGGLFLARRALTPIEQIVCRARQISTTDLSQRLGPPNYNDEVGHLVTTLDEMLERLSQAFKRQQQFTGDASHELRTPLAVIRSQAETALSCARAPDEYRRALVSIRDQAEWMSDLVSKLLFMARSDDGREQLTLETLNLADLVEGVASEFRKPAEDKGLRLTTSIEDTVAVKGDQTRLTQLLTNLVDNAIKYTPAGRVSIGLERRGRWAVVKIEDTGIGIPPEHLPHVFERFYRVDKARSRSEGSFGLGLSISDWIARSHGGRIDVQSLVGTGTTFSVYLPA